MIEWWRRFPTEVQALALQKLGWQRPFVGAMLSQIPQHVRPGERLVTLALGLGGQSRQGGVVAATDQRVLLITSSSACEIFEYASSAVVGVDEETGELTFLTSSGVRTISVTPISTAAEIGALAAVHVDSERVYRSPTVDSWGVWSVVTGVVLSVCLLLAGWALDHEFGGSSVRAHARLQPGRCLDLFGSGMSCDSPPAMLVVLAKKDGSRRCLDNHAVAILTKDWAPSVRGALPRWCVAFSSAPMDRGGNGPGRRQLARPT